MALVIDVEQYCILKARFPSKHQQDQCTQCRALKEFAIQVNNQTLDLIVEKMNQVKEGEKLDAKACVDAIVGLKTKKILRNG